MVRHLVIQSKASARSAGRRLAIFKKLLIGFPEVIYLNLCLLKMQLKIIALRYQLRYLALQARYYVFRVGKTLPKHGGRTMLVDEPLYPFKRIQSHSAKMPNVADHRPRATGSRFGTETSSRGSVHPLCSAILGFAYFF